MKQFIKNNKIKLLQEIILVIGNMQIINPTKEQLITDGWQEYIPADVEPYVPTYEERVEQLIRERYTVSDELAILRQRDTKPSDFSEYFAYCEECKAVAKSELIDNVIRPSI